MGKKKPRRAKGEGSLEHLADDTWRIRINVDTPQGKRKKSFTAKTKRKVIERRDDYLRKIKGVSYDADNLSVSEYLDRWLDDSVKQTKRPATYIEYESVCRVHIKPELGTLPLSDLRAMHIQSLLTVLKDKDLADSTRARVAAIFGSALKQAVKWQILSLDPSSGVDKPKIKTTRRKASLTPEQVRQLFRASREWRDGRLYPIMAASVLTGIRQGELCAMRWKDLDLEAGTLEIGETLHRHRGGWSYGPTKTGKTRTVELDPRLISLLKEQRKSQVQERLAAAQWTETGHVFTNSVGKPHHRAVLYQSFVRLLRREGLPKITFHELRHTCATLMGKAGAYPSTVQAILGHADIKTTLQTYTHVWPGAQRQAAKDLGDSVF